MGNCCGIVNEDSINLKRNYMQNTKDLKGNYIKGNDKLLDEVLSDTPILGLRGEEKIILIAKIQAMVRGFMAKKKV